MRLGELSSLLIFLVRAGWGYGRWLFSASKELGCGGLCPHPLRKLSFLRTFLLLPPLRTRGAANTNAGASHYHNGAAPSLRSILAPETYRSSRAATKAAWTASATARQQLVAGTARPPNCGRGTWMRLGELSSLLIFLVRAGWGYGRWLFSASNGLSCGGLCPHPLRKLSFLRTFHLLPPLRTRGAANPNAGASHYHNGAAPSLRTTLLQKRIAAVEPPPRRRGLRRLLRVSDCVQAQPAGYGSRRCGRAG